VVKVQAASSKEFGFCKNIHKRTVFKERGWNRDSKTVFLNPSHWRNPTIVFYILRGTLRIKTITD
jgi:hypothetical protein